MRSRSWNSVATPLFISFLAALAVQIVPVAFKLSRDALFSVDGWGWFILLGLASLQMALTLLPGKVGRFVGISVLLLGFFSSLLNMLNIAIFNSPISVITLSTTLQSNAQEVSEFIHTYAWPLLLTLLLYGLPAASLIMSYRRATMPTSTRPALIFLLLSLVITSPLMMRRQSSLKGMALDIHELAYTNRLATSFLRYQGISEARKQAREFWKKRADLHPILRVDRDEADSPSLVVIVIGESTSSRHMSLYGYHRPTTPVMDSMKDSLVLFSHATAPVASTLPGVIGALCLQGFDKDSLACEGPTLIEIAGAAGYETSWISNQAPGGFGDNFLVELGRTTDRVHFVNQDVSSAGEADNSASWDEKVLEPLDQVLGLAGRQLVFIHLMGTHFVYEKRYPRSETRFNSVDDISLPSVVTDRKARSIINHYDNAVAYQDKVLGRIIDRMKTSGRKALFVYFSDHGEEVYNTDNFSGHSEDRVTPAMREVPLIIGYSGVSDEKWQEWREKAKAPITTFQLTPLVTELMGLEVKTLAATRKGPPYLQK